jgi:uncharacterized BrkB/YihY/UPF0761 family membrane protein
MKIKDYFEAFMDRIWDNGRVTTILSLLIATLTIMYLYGYKPAEERTLVIFFGVITTIALLLAKDK